MILNLNVAWSAMRIPCVKLAVLNLPPISAAEFSENFKIKLAISPSCCTKLGVAEFCRVEFRRAAEPCGKDERVFLAPSKQAPSKRREI